MIACDMKTLNRASLGTLVLAGFLIGAGQTAWGFNPETLPSGLHSVTVKEIPFVYTDQGKGEPLIILSPYPFSTNLWSDLAKQLSDSFRVIVVEPPGLRAPATMDGDFSSVRLLYIYRAFVKELGFNKVHLMGVGESGGMAVAFGHHFPENTAAVISINGFESVNWSEAFEATMNFFKQSTDGGPEMLMMSGSDMFRAKTPSPDKIRNLFVPMGNEDLKNAVRARYEAFSLDVQAGIILAMLPNFNRDLMLIRSEGDGLLFEGETYARRTRSQIRKVPVRYEVLSGVGHFAFLDQPDKVAGLVTKFLVAHPISKGAPRTD